MAYKYGFADNAEYGAEDLNGLVSSLVSSGVADVFANGEAYNASALNGTVSALYTAGIVPEDVTTLKVTKLSDGLIAISPGMAFFADGSTITITEAEQLGYEAGSKNYVYLKQDLIAQNRNYPACTTSAPTGDFVLLAEISAEGDVTDRRTYARGKVPGYQSNANMRMMVDQQIKFYKTEEERTKTFSIDLGANNYSMVFVIADVGSHGSIGVYNLTDGSYFSTYNLGYRDFWHSLNDQIRVVSTHAEEISSDCKYGTLLFSVNGQTLTGSLTPALKSKIFFEFTLVFC